MYVLPNVQMVVNNVGNLDGQYNSIFSLVVYSIGQSRNIQVY